MKSTAFSQVETTDGLTLYLLTTHCSDDLSEEFKITLTDGTKVWKSIVTEDDLDNMRTKVKMDMESYVEKTKEALTGIKSSDAVFHYKFKTKKDHSVEFAWQKFVPEQDIAFQLGSTSLKTTNSSSDEMCHIFRYCIDKQSKLLERIQNLETDNERLSQDRTKALKRLEKCVEAKEELEQDLYSKFVDILNNKKEKIRELKSQIDSGGTPVIAESKDVSDSEEPSTSNGTRNTQQKRKARNKDSDEDTTDDEKQVSTPSKRGRYKKSTPDKSTDDSLVLDDGDDSPSRSPVARRAHQRGGNKKQTPAKPVLPKVSSKDKGSTEKKPSMKKSGSGSSSRSSEHLDADALLDGL